jgi:hypothetical protein
MSYEINKWGFVKNKIKGLLVAIHPIFFADAKLIMICQPKKKLLCLFYLKQKQWKKINRLPSYIMDDNTICYISLNTTLASSMNNNNPSSTGALQILLISN